VSSPCAQLGFDALLADAEESNRERRFERETRHLPAGFSDALPYYRSLVESHHTATLAADFTEALRLREEARKLARRLNHGDPGLFAGVDSPGRTLERETAAQPGSVPLFGQTGNFCVDVCGMRVRVELDGMFGIGMLSGLWPGFSANAVDFDRPFLSETGYRSFLGIHGDPIPNLTPEVFVREVLAAYVARELKGRLVPIRRECRAPGTADPP
jgi:hypothetical protein